MPASLPLTGFRATAYQIAPTFAPIVDAVISTALAPWTPPPPRRARRPFRYDLVVRTAEARWRAPAAEAREDGGAGETAIPGEHEPGGCGWFDSSHDLREGLCVREHSEADPVANRMPLADWVDWELTGWRPASGLTGLAA